MASSVRSFELTKETELRLEVSGKPLLITVILICFIQISSHFFSLILVGFQLDKGRAEVFGCEMKLKEVYSFEKTKTAIFTW